MGIAAAADVVFVLQKPSYHIGKLFKKPSGKEKMPANAVTFQSTQNRVGTISHIGTGKYESHLAFLGIHLRYSPTCINISVGFLRICVNRRKHRHQKQRESHCLKKISEHIVIVCAKIRNLVFSRIIGKASFAQLISKA